MAAQDKKHSTIEEKVAATVLEQPLASITIGTKEYKIAPPSIATLALVSTEVSHFPNIPSNIPRSKIAEYVLHNAHRFTGIGNIIAILVLGAKAIRDDRQSYIRRLARRFHILNNETRKERLSRAILEEMRPSEVFQIFLKCFGQSDIVDFFAITTSLSAANILKAEKEVVD